MPHSTPEKRRAWWKLYYARNHQKENERKRRWIATPHGKARKHEYYLKVRNDPVKHLAQKERLKEVRRSLGCKAIKMYGGSCACCGNSTYEFMSFDHVEGGGKWHRKVLHGDGFIRWLLREKRPKIRILCHNCNLAIGFYGECPHAS